MKDIETFDLTPGDGPRCEAASVTELPDGNLLACWVEYTPDAAAAGGPDNRLAVVTSKDGGRSWYDRRDLVEPPAGDVLVSTSLLAVRDRGQPELLLADVTRGPLEPDRPSVSTARLRRSVNGARSWDEPTFIWQNRPLEAPCGALHQLTSGRLLYPVARLSAAAVAADGALTIRRRAGALYSEDGGATWRDPDDWIRLPLGGARAGHLAEREGGELLLGVGTELGGVFLASSTRAGRHWSAPRTTGRSAGSYPPVVATFPSTGDLLLIWNEAPYDPAAEGCGHAESLVTMISQDDGVTWKKRRVIDEQPGAALTGPTCTFTSTGTAIVTYQVAPAAKPQSSALRIAVIDTGWFYL